MPQGLRLALEVGVREHRPRLWAAGEEVAVEVSEEVCDGAAAVVAPLRGGDRLRVRGIPLCCAHGAPKRAPSRLPACAWLGMSGGAGRSTSKWTPPPVSLRTRASPPCSRAIAATSERPSPVPEPLLRAGAPR